MATGCLSTPNTPDYPGVDGYAGRTLPHRPLAPRGCRLHRAAGGGHRDGLVGHPGHPADRRAGGRAGRLPADAELQRPGPQPPPRPGLPARTSRPATRSTGSENRASFLGTHLLAQRQGGRRLQRGGTPRRRWRPGGSEGGLGRRRRLRRHHVRPLGQRDRGRVRPEQDPGHGGRPRGGRGAQPPGLRHRLQAGLRRHRLLRHLQPAQRPPRRPAGDADRGVHPHRDPDEPPTTFEFDSVVFATGFDAISGALLAIDIRGRAGGRCGRSGPPGRRPISGWPPPDSPTCSW